MSIFIVNQCNHDPERKICSECQKINKINELQTQQRTTRKLLEHADDRISELEAQLAEAEAGLEAYRKTDKKRFAYMIKLEAQERKDIRKISKLEARLKISEPHPFEDGYDIVDLLNDRNKILQTQLEAYKKALHEISLASQSTMGGNSTDLGKMARAAIGEGS